MTDLVQLLLTAGLWSLHLGLLVSIAYLARGKPVELKVATVLFLFYSLGVLFPLEFDFFQYRVRHTPTSVALFAYVVTDILFVSVSMYLYRRKQQEGVVSVVRVDARAGNVALVALAVVAQLVNVFFNWEYLLLPKSEYIAEFGQNITPNLFYFTIPADSILVGSILFNPFKSRVARLTVASLGIGTLVLSAFQGYRHLVLLFLLVAVFRRYRRLGGFALIATTLALTVAGELSNMLKMWFIQALLDSEFDQLAYFQWYFSNVEWLPISTEQAAATANFSLGLRVMQVGSDFLQFARLLPFTSALLEDAHTTMDLIGQIVGIEYGQGTAYNLQLFLVNTLFVGGIFVLVVLLFVRTSSGTVLMIYGLEIFYSLMRNGPSFWIGQIKMMAILLGLLLGTNAAMKFLGELRLCRPTRRAAQPARHV